MCGVFSYHWLTRVPEFNELSAYETATEVERTLEMCTHTETIVHIVVERYVRQSQKMTSQPDALEVIGTLRYLARKYGAAFALQSRSERLKVAMVDLKRIGWWVPGLEHAQQAAKHALVYVSRHGLDDELVKRSLGTI